MSVRRRAKRLRGIQTGWVRNGWHDHVRAMLELQEAAIAMVLQAEREIGRWEDDGGPAAPEHVHRTAGLTLGPHQGRAGA